MTRQERMYELHRIFSARRHPVSTSALLETLGCSRSTLHRTLAVMRDQYNAPVINTPGRGYFYDRTAGAFELPGFWFGSGELESLLAMDHLLAAIQPGILRRHTDPLRTRLREILDSRTPGDRKFPIHRIRIRIEDCGIFDPRARPPLESDWDGLCRVLGSA